MARNHLRHALHRLHQMLRPAGVDDRTDDQLLARFLAARDQEAFAALVHRHGPMVLGLCRRVLRHTQDAEDAFQAAFLVLARKAASVVHRQALGSWLYRVTYRIAVNARARNDRRRAHEKQVDELPHPQVLPAEPRDWRTWLDHELNRLPERYRAVVVACDLEEQSRKEAARLLGLAEGTISSRLARGRSMLARRLARYGLSLSGTALAATLSSEASAALPVSLTSATLLAATGNGVVSASVGFLTKGALKAMFLTKLKWTVGVMMVAVALGATGLAYRVSGQAAPATAEKEARHTVPSDLEILRREIELLKLKVEVLQEKQRAQEVELRALRATADERTAFGRIEIDVDRSKKPRPNGEEQGPQSNLGLLKGDGNLQWPKALQRSEFKEARERLSSLMKQACKQVNSGNKPDSSTLSDLREQYERMKNTLDGNVDRLSPDEYIDAARYLRSIKDTITSLKQGKVIPPGQPPGGGAKPKDQSEANRKKIETLRCDLELARERAAWSERMARPDRQYVKPAQAQGDQARLRQMETQLHLLEAESALKALREARDPKAKQEAADQLEKAVKKLRERMDKPAGGSHAPR